MKYRYECGGCGDTFEFDSIGEYFCDWFDCDNDESLEYVGPMVDEEN